MADLLLHDVRSFGFVQVRGADEPGSGIEAEKISFTAAEIGSPKANQDNGCERYR